MKLSRREFLWTNMKLALGAVTASLATGNSKGKKNTSGNPFYGIWCNVVLLLLYTLMRGDFEPGH